MQGTLDDAAWATLGTLGAAIPGVRVAAPDGGAPVHTLYGGAHLFRAGTVARLGALAVAHLAEYAPDPQTLGQALGWPPHPEDAQRYERLVHKLRHAPIEDLRIDFEDGYGERGDADEDAQAHRAGEQVAIAWQSQALPRRFGVRIKAMRPKQWRRAARTLDLFCTAVAQGCVAAGCTVPKHMVVTLPKVEHRAQVALLTQLLARIERSLGWPHDTLQVELMVESPAALCDARGVHPLRGLVETADGRCIGVHFGAYDYLASVRVTGASAGLRHPACDLARALMALALADTEVALADGATQVLPLPRHTSADTPAKRDENTRVIHAAWRLHAAHVEAALAQGFYQGWDLHPSQLIARYAAVYRYFRDHVSLSCRRMGAFLDQAATAATVGEYFDDAASALGLARFFRQGLACGALDAADIAPLGLGPAAFEYADLHAMARMRHSE